MRGCGCCRGLIDPSSVALSRDGKSAYVAGSGSSAVAAFARDQATGRLTQRNCVSANATSGVDGTKGACADGNALSGATDVEVSPDGKFVYAASYDAGGVAIFERNETTGALRQVGCVRPVRTCTSARALSGASAVALSPDGENAYVAAYDSNAVVMFERDVATGLLKQLGCVSDDGHDRLCTTGNALRGAAAVVVSADGRHVYVGAAESGAVLTFVRDVETGLLRQRGCILQEAPPRGSCTSGKGLGGPIALTLSPDNRTLFAASYSSRSRSRSSRATLPRATCAGSAVSAKCSTRTNATAAPMARPLTGPTGIAVNRAGDRLYVSVESGLTVLDRDRTTGTLTVGGCLTYAGYWDEDVTKRCQLATGIAEHIVGCAQP